MCLHTKNNTVNSVQRNTKLSHQVPVVQVQHNDVSIAHENYYKSQCLSDALDTHAKVDLLYHYIELFPVTQLIMK